MLQIIIINDCCDQNARFRQQARVQNLFGVMPIFCPVDNDIVAAGNLIDVFDTIGTGLVLVNVAPRKGTNENGSPFCYFFYNDVLVVSTFRGYALSLVKKLKLVNQVHVLGPEVFSELNIEGNRDTQFRSLELTPLVGKALLNHPDRLSSKAISINEIPDIPLAAWFVDNFGNIKTTILYSELADSVLDVRYPSYSCIKEIPDGQVGILAGSSGYKRDRFVEIILKGRSASEKLRVKMGDLL